MLLVYIWLYTFILVVAWALFIVAKLHSYKFKNFSTDIEKVTTTLFIFLLSISILWYILIFFLGWNVNNSASVDTSTNYDSVSY